MQPIPILFLAPTPALSAAVANLILSQMVRGLAASSIDLAQPDAVARKLARLGHSSTAIAALLDAARHQASKRRKAVLN